LFTGEDVFKRIKVLSGGEKSRVALAKVLISEANFLLLDEPTNHLDMMSVNILIQALQQYEGSYVVVSHDRFFVSEIANKIWYIEDEQIKEYPGTYDEYEIWQAERQANAAPAPVEKKAEAPKVEAKTQVSDFAKKEAQKQIKKLNQKVSDLEDKISKLEEKKADLEHQLGDPAIYNDSAALAKANASYQEVQQNLAQANQDWESAMIELEEVEASIN
jgi:ATP-binding cassette subfamily F protein 3